MTESLFDPTGPDTERSGSRNLGPDAQNISHMPPEVTDGKADDESPLQADEDASTEAIAEAEEEVTREQAMGQRKRPEK